MRRINISWGIPDKQVSGQLLSPTLAQQHIDYTTWPQDEWTDRAGGLQLSLLEILPQHAESANVWHPPVILAARTIVPSPSASFHESVETVLDRWELVADQPQALHSAFEQLASRRNSTITQPKVSSSCVGVIASSRSLFSSLYTGSNGSSRSYGPRP